MAFLDENGLTKFATLVGNKLKTKADAIQDLYTINKIGGRNIIWNNAYKVNSNATTTANGIEITYSLADNTITLDGTATANGTFWFSLARNVASKIITGHKVLMMADQPVKLRNGYGTSFIQESIITGNGTLEYSLGLEYNTGDSYDNVTFTIIGYDLTLMFGSGNEPTIEEFKAMFPFFPTERNVSQILPSSVIEVQSISDTLSEGESNPIDIYRIPDAIQALEGYGWSAGSVYNYVDFERKVFVKNVARVDLGSLTWEKYDNGEKVIFGSRNYFLNPYFIKFPTSAYNKANIICKDYINISYGDYEQGSAGIFAYTDIEMGGDNPMSGIGIYDTTKQSMSVADFKSSLANSYLYYELDTPIETDISGILDNTNIIRKKSDGTLLFVCKLNDTDGNKYYNIPVPNETEQSTVTGLKSGAYVNAYQHPTSPGYKHIPSGGSTGNYLKYSSDGTATWSIPDNATTSNDGFMSSEDKTKLNGIESGAQVNTITGVKGNSETSYRTGNVNITAANIGAATSDHTHDYAGSSSAGGSATTADALLAPTKMQSGTIQTVLGDKKLRYLIVKEAVEGAPADSKVLHLPWDTTGNYDSQLAISTTGSFQIRTGKGSTTGWNDWATILTNNSTLDAAKISGTIDSSCYTDTTYTAGTGLSLSNTAFSIDTAKVVTIDTSQDITAKKTFKSIPNMRGSSSIVKGTNPSSTQYPMWMNILESGTGTAEKNRLGSFNCSVDKNGNVTNSIYSYKFVADTATASSMGICYPSTGTAYAFCPTPPANSNNTNIATTAWVRTHVSEEYLSKAGGTLTGGITLPSGITLS